MINQDLEQKLFQEYCDELSPLADTMVRHIALATFELGVEGSKELLAKAFDLVFSRVTERLFEELDRLSRAAVKPELLQ